MQRIEYTYATTTTSFWIVCHCCYFHAYCVYTTLCLAHSTRSPAMNTWPNVSFPSDFLDHYTGVAPPSRQQFVRLRELRFVSRDFHDAVDRRLPNPVWLHALFSRAVAAAGQTYQTKCVAGRIFGLCPDGYSVLLI